MDTHEHTHEPHDHNHSSAPLTNHTHEPHAHAHHHHHDHDHSHGHHHHHLDVKSVNARLMLGIVINLAFVGLEFGAGWYYQSVGLMSDAGHNLSDVASLVLAVLGFKLSQAPADDLYTFGKQKATILAALANSSLLIGAILVLTYQCVLGFFYPRVVAGEAVAWVAGAGIFINGLTALLFFRDKDEDVNMQGAYMHMLMDALVSFGVVLAGILIYFTGWAWVDAVMGLVILGILAKGAWALFVQTYRLAAGAVPPAVNVSKIRTFLNAQPEIQTVKKLHIWGLSSSQNAAILHLYTHTHLEPAQMLALKNRIRHELEHQKVQTVFIETDTIA
jgi:cobalt-zinc-cadmium efflux system protein